MVRERPGQSKTVSGDDWLWGWDFTPGIVSIYATRDGRAQLWRRIKETGELVHEIASFRPWLIIEHIEDLAHLGTRLVPHDDVSATSYAMVRYRELNGPGALRHLVSADDGRTLAREILHGASKRLGKQLNHLNDLDEGTVLSLQPDEQYLVATGRTYFQGLSFDDLQRLQFDLETTGLNARHDRVFMISVRYPDGSTEILEAPGADDIGEAALIRLLMDRVRAADPDVIENHNLHGFDIPFLEQRSRILGVSLTLGRVAGERLRQRASMRGAPSRAFSSSPDDSWHDGRRVRFVAPGRELIDTLDAVRRHDFSTRDLPGHGLKAVAKHMGFASPDREYIAGDQIYATYRTDPERVRRYATDDVEEVAKLARMLGGAAYALAQMVPRRYERLADAGAATGVIDPLLVRAYVRAGMALPAHQAGDGTTHYGAALHLFACGVAHRIVKADVASLYPSLMRAYRIGPSRDRLGALLTLVDGLVERRLDAKTQGRAAPAGSSERYAHEAMSAALKIVVNSAYGYMGSGGLTRFSDVHAANEVTRRGREVLALLCREFAARGVTLLEADTDGVYFAVPESWSEMDEKRVVLEVATLLPPLVQLEFEGRYAAMLSHEPKNYALLTYDDKLILRGVAFRSSRSEPYGDKFLRQVIRKALTGDVVGIRDTFLSTIAALRVRAIPTYDVSSHVRLTKSSREYLESRAKRRESSYEAMLSSGRPDWSTGERVRVYRKQNGESALVPMSEQDAAIAHDPRDYDVEHYVRLLRVAYAQRLARAFKPEDFATLFADADQFALFAHPVESIAPVLTPLSQELREDSA